MVATTSIADHRADPVGYGSCFSGFSMSEPGGSPARGRRGAPALDPRGMTLHAVIDNREHRGAGLAAVPSAGAASGRRPSAAAPARVALVGNPNVGKSVIFGALTGTYATVSNYPGTTVEVARARGPR